jgi:two-component system cell cycle response regulator
LPGDAGGSPKIKIRVHVMYFSSQKVSGRILIVDDNRDICEVLKKFMEKSGHSVECSYTGEEAVRKIKTGRYDIVITDIVMPGIDGMAILKYIRVNNPDIEVIAMTGYGSIESAIGFMKAGAIDYIAKPVNMDHLEIIVRKALERKDLIKAAAERDLYFRQSLTDGMTGLFNHKYYHEQLSRELASSIRLGTNLSVIMIDIDNFKNINDSFGHQAGDIVIKDIAADIINTCRVYDTVARYGGEEFAIILPTTDMYVAEKIAIRTLKAISSKSYKNISRAVTASIGISSFPEHATDKDALIKKADIALYFSKQSGKNRHTIYSDMIGMDSGRKSRIADRMQSLVN